MDDLYWDIFGSEQTDDDEVNSHLAAYVVNDKIPCNRCKNSDKRCARCKLKMLLLTLGQTEESALEPVSCADDQLGPAQSRTPLSEELADATVPLPKQVEARTCTRVSVFEYKERTDDRHTGDWLEFEEIYHTRVYRRTTARSGVKCGKTNAGRVGVIGQTTHMSPHTTHSTLQSWNPPHRISFGCCGWGNTSLLPYHGERIPPLGGFRGRCTSCPTCAAPLTPWVS